MLFLVLAPRATITSLLMECFKVKIPEKQSNQLFEYFKNLETFFFLIIWGIYRQ